MTSTAPTNPFNKLWQPSIGDDKSILVACSDAIELTNSISAYSGMSICPIIADKFNNGEIRVKLQANVRNKHAFIVCPMRTQYINDDCMELFLVIDACNRSDVDKVTVILPYFPYARSDKKDEPRVPIAASIITQFLQTLRVSNVVSVDLHAAQLQALMPKGFHNLYIKNTMCQAFVDAGILLPPGTTTATVINNRDYVFVAPDAGSIKRTEAYAAAFGMNYIILHKQRDYTRPGTIKRSMIIADSPELYRGKTAIIIDDIGDTMGTMIAAINELCTKADGCKSAIIGLTHGVFSTTADGICAYQKIEQCHFIDKVFVTNSLTFQEPGAGAGALPQSKITKIDIAPLLACTIDGIITGKSVSQLM